MRHGILIGIFLQCMVNAFAQPLTTPRVSPYSQVTQRVGISEVSISYSSPAVNKRTIWGSVVPYDQIWRAGANENTTISLTHNAKIEGREINAGTYGLFMIPKKDKVILVLSRYHQSWGTVYPKEDELALTVPLKMEESPFQEWLSYDFIDRQSRFAIAALTWEKTRIPFKIEFDVDQIVIENARAELKGPVGFSWQGYSQAAAYCLQADTNLDEAMQWIDQSIQMSKGFTNLQVKADLLVRKGDAIAAKKIMEEAIPMANGYQLNNYGYSLLNNGDTKGAIKIFEENIERNPEHPFIWGFTDSLGEAYLKDGNKKLALQYYKKARTLAPANQWAYLDGVIAGFK